MPLPKKRISRRKTKQTYLGSGAGSLRSGTGATAKKSSIKRKRTPSQTKKNLQRLDDLIKKSKERAIGEFRAITPITPKSPKSPATGLGSVFEKQKTRKKRTATTMRRRAKR
jgi:hypothetical protein